MNNFDYKYMTPFKWFVLENFPFIENDFEAINNYRLFSKVVEYLNKMKDNVNLTGQQMENLTNAMIELQDYVNNYFDNLDVQDEINNKLDEMAQDGTLTNLIKDYVDPFINIQNTQLANMQTQLNAVASGSPAGVYATVAALTTADPDHSKIYVVTADGHWYYYGNNQWNDGGLYQTPEDSDSINEIFENITVLNDELFEKHQETTTYKKLINTPVTKIVPTNIAFYGSKNFLNIQNGDYEENGVSITVENNTLTVSGTPSQNTTFRIPLIDANIKNNKQYYLTAFRINNDNESNTGGVDISLCTNRAYEYSNDIQVNTGFYSGTILRNYTQKGGTTNYENFNALRIYIPANRTNNGNKFKLMLSITNDLEYDYNNSVPIEINDSVDLYNIQKSFVQSWNNVNITYYNYKLTDYNTLKNKPKINNFELINNKSLNSLIENNENFIKLFDLEKLNTENVQITKEMNYYPNNSTIENFINYSAFVNNDPEEEISDIFDYSCEMKPRGSYPLTCIKPKLVKNGYQVDFMIENTNKFEVKAWTTAKFIIISDNVQISNEIEIENANESLIKVVFATTKPRHIKIWFAGDTSFAGINTDGLITKYNHKELILVSDGDSIIESAHTNIQSGYFNGFGSIISRILKTKYINSGLGGTGYLNAGPNNRQNMVDRFDDTIALYNPDILLICAGLNDSELTMAQVKDNIDDYYEKVKLLNPEYVIIVSPYSPQPTGNISNGVLEITNYLKEIAITNNWCFIDIVNGYTYDEFANIITKNSNGCIVTQENQYKFYEEYYEGTSIDRTHPNNYGNNYIGNYIANEMYKIINYKKGMFHNR